MFERIIAYFRRWCHCMWWFLRPWVWSKEQAHCSVNIYDPRFSNPHNHRVKISVIGCDCGRIFWATPGADPAVFDQWMERLNSRRRKRS